MTMASSAKDTAPFTAVEETEEPDSEIDAQEVFGASCRFSAVQATQLWQTIFVTSGIPNFPIHWRNYGWSGRKMFKWREVWCTLS
jgi:hypothetical protein